jgi:hypothetical protein
MLLLTTFQAHVSVRLLSSHSHTYLISTPCVCLSFIPSLYTSLQYFHRKSVSLIRVTVRPPLDIRMPSLRAHSICVLASDRARLPPLAHANMPVLGHDNVVQEGKNVEFYPNCDISVWMRSCAKEEHQPVEGKLTGLYIMSF